MDLKQMKAFLTICEFQNVTRASEQLGYAQSTVTSQIQSLEKEYGVKLFEKIGRNIHLTADGKTMEYYAKQMVALEQQLKEDYVNLYHVKQILRIGVAESLCYQYFPSVCNSFSKLYPNVEFKVVFSDSHHFASMLINNEIDIGLSLSNLILHKKINILHKEKASLALLVNPNHILCSKSLITAQDLEPFPFYLTVKGCAYRTALERILNEKDVFPKVELETDSKEILKRFAMNSKGITFLPETTAALELSDKKLVKLPWNQDFKIFFQVLIHEKKRITPLMRAFIDCIEAIPLQ